jgi:class 3 adenylate cyclase/tetratricopeptide (TPR) repeat protein
MPVTKAILFTDLVGSTELLARIGQPAMEGVRREHFRLMREAIAETGGREIKTVGDAFMVAFDSASEAVRCGVAMQVRQRTTGRLQRTNGVAMRVGISFGEVDDDASDLFGLPVIEAGRLCAACAGGQVLISDLARALARSAGATFQGVGALDLKGLPEPLPASEVLYELRKAEPFLATTPFVGRDAEVGKLREKLTQAKSGSGALVMLVGEPGIGKTRVIEELSVEAREGGVTVIAGRCFEGDWAPPFGPFVEAVTALAQIARPEELRADMGYGGPPLARLALAIAEVLPDIGEPAPLAPNEEQFRILDAVSQLLLATAKRAPVLLVLDDLHWADGGTLAMLRHVARFLKGSRILVLGAYRDVELDRQHPLGEALAQLRRESEYERILLRGLDEAGVGQLLSAIAEQDVQAPFVKAISDETDGNPFFIRETLLHLVEEGKLVQEDGAWRSAAGSIEELGIPEGVRQVIGRRLSRLGDSANRLLTAASAFSGPFPFGLAASGAGIPDADALDAVDVALTAQLIRSAGVAETYEFTHALIRHTLYSEMNPSRQVRLHRKLAEAMEAIGRSTAAEIAYQYHRSAALPGAERGVEWALKAADEAESRYAWEQVVTNLRMAREITPPLDARLTAVVRRLALALAAARQEEELETTLEEAVELTLASAGNDPAAEFIGEATRTFANSGQLKRAMQWAPRGLALVTPGRRDETWARLAMWELVRRAAASRQEIGIILPADDLVDLWGLAMRLGPRAQLFLAQSAAAFESVQQMDAAGATNFPMIFIRGQYGAEADWLFALSLDSEREGRFDMGASQSALAGRLALALGDWERAEKLRQRAEGLAARLPGAGAGAANISAYGIVRRTFLDEDWEAHLALFHPSGVSVWEGYGGFNDAAVRGAQAFAEARVGNVEAAMQQVASVQRAIELAPGNATDYPSITHAAAEALWLTARTAFAENLERNIRVKVVAGGFHYPMCDGRLSLARLCALQGRLDEARHWFAEARMVLDEQGARPLRAICDYDEALALIRHEGRGMRDEGFPADVRVECERLLGAALDQFREIGMTGWIRRAEALLAGGIGP